MTSIYIRTTLILAALFSLAACSSQQAANIERGSDVTFREGYPEVRILAVGLFDEQDMPGIDLTINIVKGSLIYRTRDEIYSADYELLIQVVQIVNRERVLIQNRSTTKTISESDPNIISSGEVIRYQERIPLMPGQYEVIVGIKDVSSGNQTVRRAETTIPDPESDKIDVTSVVLLGKNNADALGFTPITTYFIPARYDSLKFQFQVTRPDLSEDTRVLMELFSFVSDTLPAREISGIQYPQGSIGFRGIDYNRTIKIEETERILRFETGSILIEYIIPVLPSANYRFEVHINKNLESTEKAYKAREFFISSSRNFPNVQSIPEFAAPLVYLMNNREYNALKSIGGLDTLKHEVDRFWLSGIQNLNRTRQVMELYYTRVEQANKQFSNYKEGWKTDMGMIFILFGPPMYVENTLDTMTWFYSYNRNDPRTTFRFYKPRPTDQFFPYQHYILLRDRFYHSIEYDRIQNWRNGYILNLR